MSDATRPEPPAPQFRLSLKGGGVSVDQDITRAQAFQILAVVMGDGLPVPLPPGPSAPASPPSGGAHHLSLQEKIDSNEAKRWPDKVLVIGQHLQDAGNARFSKADVRRQIDVARLGKPGNYDRDFTWTVRVGWIAPDSTNSKLFYVTKKGAEAIAKKFSSEVKKATTEPRPVRRRKKSTPAA